MSNAIVSALVAEGEEAFAETVTRQVGRWSSGDVLRRGVGGVELANLAGDTLEQVTAAAERGIHGPGAPTTCPTRSFGTAA